MENAHLEYQRQSVKQSSPEELITKLYDLAILSCYKKDKAKVREILNTLIKSLNFEYEISATLYELYDYCRNILDEDKYDEVKELLEPIRDAWIQGVAQKRTQNVNLLNNRGFVA